ncbi:glycoside hydrolase family 19 protein [Flavobacterium davisii]|uniref:Glycoside hydrolase family 19 catalytic domain-containing protein n=1 Tax=Flavobacterium columnare TaxID=996 RepID=A0A8G0P836_9FLAO|nr:hypothetical protein [Flavobacterium davisii]QYS89564.1 hypothetical protein JJC05_04665 [Flavobacterium davisii]
MLTKALMKKAMQGETDIRELEFYVTVEYYKNKKHTTANVDIQNPLPTENTPPSQSTGIKKAKGSPAEEKPKSKKEESGLLNPISETLGEIWDWVETQGTALRDKPHTIEIPEGKSPTIVGKTKEVKKEEKKTTGKCPNCDKDITVAELRQIFEHADLTTLTKVAATYNKYMKELGMNTCWNKAHFFAQARIESGASLHVSGGENFNWYWESLITTFSAFQTAEGKEKAKLWGRTIKDRRDPKCVDVSQENQKKIANYAYSPPAEIAKELENTQPNDGWNFRGKGLLQLTGRNAYTYANTYTKKEGANIIINPDLVVSDVSIAVLSSMAFWKWKNLNTISNLTKDVIKKICSKVGKNTPIKDENNHNSTNHIEKKKMFDKTTSKVFKIDECKLGDAENVSNDKGTVIVISGKGSKYISNWVVYKTRVYQNMSLDTYKKLNNTNKLPNPEYVTYLSRDAHGDKAKYGKHSELRYGTANETPPVNIILFLPFQVRHIKCILVQTVNLHLLMAYTVVEGCRNSSI